MWEHGNHTPATGPSPLQVHVAFESTDLAQIQDVASQTQHPLSVHVPGRVRPMRFRLHHHPLSAIAITHGRLDYEGRVTVSAPALEEHYYLQLPLVGGARVDCGTSCIEVQARSGGLVLSPGLPSVQRQEGAFEEITLEIDRATVERTWCALTGEPTSAPIVFEPALPLDREPGASVARLVRFLVGEIGRPNSALTSRVVCERLEEALLIALLDGQPHSLSGQLTRGTAVRGLSFVQQAEAWLEAHATGRATPARVAAMLGVSLRTLQRSFASHRGYTPREFLRHTRLDQAYRRLRQGGPECSVTRVALEVGFEHLGRFSGHYRARFGEHPSATLRKAPGSRPSRRRRNGEGASTMLGLMLPKPRRDVGTCGFCTGEMLPARVALSEGAF